ncbi:MAG: TonB-dependent receptor [Bacteroidales bacterium]|nr:TonB-dependent receptor [Bacteroidales bacterium]
MKNSLKSLLLIALFIFSSAYSYAQTGISGTIKDAEFNSPLPGAAIMIKGTSTGTISDVNGDFELPTQAGTFDIVISFLGYESKTMSVTVTQGKMTRLGEIVLKAETQGINEIYVVADRAKERETPVAISNIEKKQIEQQLGSRDIPLIMNSTPSVYSTAQGGGAGDARINVRGFNQRNVAIMINGVPVNDMENGWVYWSNWDGISDATSSIQMQRGLSAVNLATPSIGGTMNIITSPAEKKAGGSAKFEYGSGTFLKATVSGNTGMINDKFALSAAIVRKTGVGIIDATWTDAWAYYLGSTFKINKKNKLELFVMGAPQRHGQNLYKQNAAAYSHEYAQNELGYTQLGLDAYPEADADRQYPGYGDAKAGRYYNENWNIVSSSYTGQQWWNGKAKDRHSSDFINERENYYHKPLINLNWYSHFTDKISLYTVAYYSGGKGGGSGTYGSLRWNYNEGIVSPSRFVMWDATIANNQASSNGSLGILRNSVNEQWTVGALSKLKILVNENFKASVGLDWRTAEIDHFREIRDLLGGSYYFWDGNDFDSPSDYQKGLGDKFNYYFTNTVDWFGYYLQGEYTNEKITAYATFGHSFIKYTYTNHFVDDGTGNELFSQTDYLPGYQIKGGLSYRPTSGLSFFGNYGYISKAPIFDNIINDRTGTVAAEVKNEKFNAFEFGAIYATPDKRVDVKANYYYTEWKDRARSIGITNEDGTEGYVFVNGMNQLHTGFELEANYHPFNFMAVGVMGSFGNWEHTNDVSGVYYTYDNVGQPPTEESYNYYVDGLKIGDAPQTQVGAMLTVYPVKDFRLQLDYRHYKKFYADWDPFSRTDPNDRTQVWRTPAYSLVDFHFSYKFPIKSDKWGMTLSGHVFNLLDEMYVQDARDESRYNAVAGAPAHSAMRAEVYLGLPRTFNFGLKVTF